MRVILLGSQINKVNLRVKTSLGVCRQLIELFQNGALSCFQRVAPCAKQLQRLTISKKECLSRFADNQLTPSRFCNAPDLYFSRSFFYYRKPWR